jgi:hypothetical protein
MVLAIEQMDPVVQGIFFLAAVICFALAALSGWRTIPWSGSLVALGLALFGIPFMWNAFAAA